MYLILNCGSSSLKFKIYNSNSELIAEWDFRNLSSKDSHIKYKVKNSKIRTIYKNRHY